MKKSEKFTIPLWEKLKKENKDFKVVCYNGSEILHAQEVTFGRDSYIMGMNSYFKMPAAYKISWLGHGYCPDLSLEWEEKDWIMVENHGATIEPCGYFISQNSPTRTMYMVYSPTGTFEAFFFNEKDCKDFINKKNNE